MNKLNDDKGQADNADSTRNSELNGALGADKFTAMTKSEALKYCYTHEDKFLRDYGKGGQRAFDCLISIIESDTISPKELPEYGMDY